MESARWGGLVKIAAGVLLTALIVLVLPKDLGGMVSARTWAVATLVGPFLSVIGLLELMSGIAAGDWTAHWDALPVWLQFALGGLALVATVVAVIAVIAASRA